MQTILLFQVYYLATLIIYCSNFPFSSWLTFTLFIPFMIPLYSIISSIEEFTKKEMIQKTLNSTLPSKINVQSTSIDKDELTFP